MRCDALERDRLQYLHYRSRRLSLQRDRRLHHTRSCGPTQAGPTTDEDRLYGAWTSIAKGRVISQSQVATSESGRSVVACADIRSRSIRANKIVDEFVSESHLLHRYPESRADRPAALRPPGRRGTYRRYVNSVKLTLFPLRAIFRFNFCYYQDLRREKAHLAEKN